MEHYVQFAKEFVREAGTIAKKYFNSDTTQWKDDMTPVTKADLEINTLLITKVNELFPWHRVIGEEESTNNESDYCWICDPIDGTILYRVGIPVFSVCISLLHKWKPLLGVIYDPIMDRLFYGDGQSSYLNDEIINVNNEDNLEKCVIAIENFPKDVYDLGELYKQLTALNIKVVQFASIAYPTALIASGQVSATIFPMNQIWEFAPAMPIITGAGGKVTTFTGDNPDFLDPAHCYVASNGKIHDFILDIIKKTVKID